MKIYEKHPHTDAYRVRDSFEPYAVLAKDKRLSDSEIAAEHWAHCWLWDRLVANDDGYEGGGWTREIKRRAYILERFAILPHFDEVDQ